MKRKLRDAHENIGKRTVAQNRALFDEIETVMHRNMRSLLTLSKVIATGAETIRTSNNMAESGDYKQSALSQVSSNFKI